MGPRTRALRRRLRPVVALLVVVFGLIQFVPYGWEHPNPPVVDPVRWPSTEAERLARASCYDCHSNQTVHPDAALNRVEKRLLIDAFTEMDERN